MTMTRDIFGCHNSKGSITDLVGGGPGCYLTSSNAQDSPTTQNDLAPNVNSAKIEKPWFGPLGICPESAALIGLFLFVIISLICSYLDGLVVTEFFG